jgi:predicted P-loop ATPase
MANGSHAKSQDPKTWDKFDSVLAAFNRRGSNFDGFGFALGQRDDGMCYVGADLDSCIVDGAIADWALPFVELLANTLGEVSPSGTGIKVFGLCDIEDVEAVRPAFGLEGNAWGRKFTFGDNGKDHGPAIELYFAGRYFTVTGQRHDAFSSHLAKIDRDTLRRLAKLLPSKPGSDNKTKAGDKSRSASALRLGQQLKREGKTFDEMCEALAQHPDTKDWYREKGAANGKRELKRIWNKDTDEDSRKRPNALAVVEAIFADPLWRQAVRFNRFTEKIEVSEQFLPTEQITAYRKFEEQADELEAMLAFQAKPGFHYVSKNTIWDALCAVANRNAYHPVRDYLEGLKWDHKQRLRDLFIKYFGAELPDVPEEIATKDDQEQWDENDRISAYLEHISQCWLVGAVARVYQPGRKVDNVPALVGPQGLGKSQGVEALCPYPDWFMEDLSTDLTNRDTKESLSGKLIIELAEFPHVKKEADKVKHFFSLKVDRYRKAYGKGTADHPRQCVFIATTNQLEFIDPTGNRRVWPIELVGPIKVDVIAEDRDQLWAEAVHLFKQKFKWWLPPEVEGIARQQQDQYQEEDVWRGRLQEWIDGRAGELDEPFSIHDAMKEALGFYEVKAIKRADEMRAAHQLRILRCRRVRKRKPGGKPQWLWLPPKQENREQ